MIKHCLIVLLVALYCPFQNFANSATEEGKEKVKWLSIEEALALNEKEPRKIIIDFYTDWCGWCKKMERTTFNHPQIAKYINKNFYPVKFDAEGDKVVRYKDLDYNATKSSRPGKFGTHEFAYYMANNKGKMGYPTIVFLDEESAKIDMVPSYLKPADLDGILKYFVDDHYKNTSWGIFSGTYKSRIKE